MTQEEIKEYLLEELADQRRRYLTNDTNHYSYLWMILNDIGIETPEMEDLKNKK